MPSQHATITDPNVHEPKGAVAAAINTVYVSDGAGSGHWRKPPYTMTYAIQDAHAAGPDSYWLIIPYACTLTKAYVVVNDAFSMDQTISFSIATIPITNGSISLVAAGSGAGSIFFCTPTALNTISAGTALEIINTGGSASAFIASLTLTFVPTA